jgi:hypothetical protein
VNRQELIALHAQLSTEAKKLLETRNKEYATEENIFANFDAEAEFLEVPAEKIVLMYIKENLDRLKNMHKLGKKVDPQQVRDKTIDLINFSILHYAIVNREGKKK